MGVGGGIGEEGVASESVQLRWVKSDDEEVCEVLN
jgi:hypothetical protein